MPKGCNFIAPLALIQQFIIALFFNFYRKSFHIGTYIKTYLQFITYVIFTYILEEDAIRPEDLSIRKKLNQQDPYGNAKFGGEEVLQDQNSKENGFPWVAFRYADVIGPRDVTRRFAFYHTWLKFFNDIKVPFYMPQKLDKVISKLFSFEKIIT